MTTLVTGVTGFVGSAGRDLSHECRWHARIAAHRHGRRCANSASAASEPRDAVRDAPDWFRRNGYLANIPEISVSPSAAAQ
jgi:hypothetical protein